MDFVLITGATGGIGYALAEVFAQHGWGVALNGSDPVRLQAAKERLAAQYGIPVESFCQNLQVLGGATALYDAVRASGISIKVLVNNAGFGLVGGAETLSLEREEQMLVLNMVSPTELTKLFLRDMLAVGEGKILNVASNGAFQPGPYTAAYYASKSYVLSYTRAVRYEMKERGIQVSALCPGATRTHFFQQAGVDTPQITMSPEQVAAIAYQGLMARRETIVPGWGNRLFALLPRRVKTDMVAKIKRRAAEKAAGGLDK